MLEAGEIVLVTLAIAFLFCLCCGVIACMMFFDREPKRPVVSPRRTQLVPQSALPPVVSVVQPMYSEKSTETQQQTVSPPQQPVVHRQRRNSGTQTENHEIIVQEEDLRTESSLSAVVRPQALQFPRKIQIGAAPAEAITTQHTAEDFISDLSQLKRSPHSVLEDEFEILRRRATARWKSREVADMNYRRNRYQDVVPYDENRVTLQGGDYINASFIDGYLSSRHFIATQWPIAHEELPDKDGTSDQFWKMIWEHRVQAIVSLSGRNDSLPPFWPPLRGVRTFGEITVEQDRSYEEAAGCLVRLFTMTRRDELRKIHQFHIPDWEDGDISEESKVLFLAQKIKDYSKPVVVHCSAGIGRTGVFIAVCRLLSQANQRGLIDVFSVVDTMRQQRAGMVRTREQYESIYDILRLAIESRLISKQSRI